MTRWTIPVSVCKTCDKGRDPMEVPAESCGHDPETHRTTVGLEVIPASFSEQDVERVAEAISLEQYGERVAAAPVLLAEARPLARAALIAFLDGVDV